MPQARGGGQTLGVRGGVGRWAGSRGGGAGGDRRAETGRERPCQKSSCLQQRAVRRKPHPIDPTAAEQELELGGAQGPPSTRAIIGKQEGAAFVDGNGAAIGIIPGAKEARAGQVDFSSATDATSALPASGPASPAARAGPLGKRRRLYTASARARRGRSGTIRATPRDGKHYRASYTHEEQPLASVSKKDNDNPPPQRGPTRKPKTAPH